MVPEPKFWYSIKLVDFMPAKHLTLDMDHNVIDRKVKVTTRVKAWDDTWTKQYWLERDRVIFRTTKDEQTKKDILERYGK